MSCSDILTWVDANSGALNDPNHPAKSIDYVGSAKALNGHDDRFCAMWDQVLNYVGNMSFATILDSQQRAHSRLSLLDLTLSRCLPAVLSLEL